MSNDNTVKRPTHTAYSVRDYQKNGQPDSEWTRIGVAWAHRDGEGFDIHLDALPVNGRVVIRRNKPKANA
jgi:hypothetical protein